MTSARKSATPANGNGAVFLDYCTQGKHLKFAIDVPALWIANLNAYFYLTIELQQCEVITSTEFWGDNRFSFTSILFLGPSTASLYAYRRWTDFVSIK